MASFFKASCAVYWLTWLFCLAYLMGTSLYTDRFIYADIKEAQAIRDYIWYLCVFNIAYSFVGCVFVKCNITHVLYAALFVFPMLGVNFALSIMGLIESKTSTDKFPLPFEMIQIAQRFLAAHENQYPTWLHHTQENANCCGILSFLDYPAFLYPDATRLVSSLPQSCCFNGNNKTCTQAFDLHDHPNATIVVLKTAYLPRVERCHSRHAEWIKENRSHMPPIKNQNAFMLLPNMASILPTCGCYHLLKDAYNQLFGTAHFIFFIMILILTGVMLFVYIKNWCNNRGLDSGSEHSLDTDNMSLLNINLGAVDPFTKKDVKDSAGVVPDKTSAKTNVNIGDGKRKLTNESNT